VTRRLQLVLAVTAAAACGLGVGMLITLALGPSGEQVRLRERQLEVLEQLGEVGRYTEKRLPDLELSIATVESQAEELDELILAGDEAETAERIHDATLGAGFTVVRVESLGTRAAVVSGHDVVEVRHRVTASTPRCCWAEAFEKLEQAPLLVLFEDFELHATADPETVEVGFVAVTTRVPEGGGHS